MKRSSTIVLALALVLTVPVMMSAQWMAPIQYWRPYDQTGLNVFETSKDSNAAFTGLGVRIGGGFAQGYQVLSHENYVTGSDGKYREGTWTRNDSANSLYKIGAGFNNASANLNIDAQLARGVRLNLTLYLSSRHHQETWVKGGYIQFDDLSFIGSEFIDDLMRNITIKVGHMEINYGDAHFRRSDGGSTLYNPFIENYLIDAFTTEIGGDITYQNSGFIGVFGITNGEIKGNIVPLADTLDKSPAIYGKLGYDTKIGDDGRVRITGSVYTQSQSPRNTLFWGDRTGSNYYMVMEKAYSTYNTVASSTTAQAWSGRLNPNFGNNVTAFEINAFAQFGGLEFFGTYDLASGSNSPAEHNSSLGDRELSQIAADLLYRFGSTRDFYIGARYNMATVEEGFKNTAGDDYLATSSTRIAFAAGWYMLDQVFLKAEYMMQDYTDYPDGNYRKDGKINGLTIQAVVGF